MLTTTIHTGDAAVVYLAEALGRVRELTDIESRILHRALRRDAGMFRRWTEQDDARLRKMRRAKLPVAHMAEVLGRTEDSVKTRLRDLRKREKTNGR